MFYPHNSLQPINLCLVPNSSLIAFYNVWPFEIQTESATYLTMARPKRKTEATTLKMTPEVRDLWERCAALEHRSLTNMFEVMVREHAKKLNLAPIAAPVLRPATSVNPTSQ